MLRKDHTNKCAYLLFRENINGNYTHISSHTEDNEDVVKENNRCHLSQRGIYSLKADLGAGEELAKERT